MVLQVQSSVPAPEPARSPALTFVAGGRADGTPARPCTGAGLPLETLARATHLACDDRLLIIGAVSGEAIGMLMTGRRAALSVVRADRPYPCPEPVDVAWLLGVHEARRIDARLSQALRCLAPMGRLAVEVDSCAIGDVAAIAASLRRAGLIRVAVESARPGVMLVCGELPQRHYRAA